MFYELIYTRCRQGMDILKKGQPILSDGYKVYACTPDLMAEGVVELPFLSNAVQTKQSFKDPDFMEDAYLYYVPKKGSSFLVNFHPVRFDANAKGDYSHRPGNFVNHALAGDFSDFYPFELFNDDAIWHAKMRGEEYYYKNVPSALSLRNDINHSSKYLFERIAEFVSDGRKEALAQAVSFLIAQYETEPKDRKFLVIRDESSEKIELWIAAIEHAFSPRIASSIPFATRMDKFLNTNKYTVNQLGAYQTQMNLQDPNQERMYRAMIVGVDERDKANVDAARPLANSPFVLLDGKKKQAMFAEDISHPYYQLVMRFDKELQQSCRDFLQTFDIAAPSTAILDLYQSYTILTGTSKPSTCTLANALQKLHPYQASNTNMLRELYSRVNSDVARYLQEDVLSGFMIIRWSLTAAKIVGDYNAKRKLSEIVCMAFTELLFSANKDINAFWAQIKNSEFVEDIAHVMTDMKTMQDNINSFNEFTPSDKIAFLTIYLECDALTPEGDQLILQKIVYGSLVDCYQKRDKTSACEIISILSLIEMIHIPGFLFLIIRNHKDEGFSEFVIECYIDTEGSVIQSDEDMSMFCMKLADEKLNHVIESVLNRRLNMIRDISDVMQFTKTVVEMASINKDLIGIFESIDKRIYVTDKKAYPLANQLQTCKPQGASCINSAHIYALEVMSQRKEDLKEIWGSLHKRGFPSEQSQKYIDTLTKLLIKAQLTKEEQLYMLQQLERAPRNYLYTYAGNLCETAANQSEKWNVLLDYVAESKHKEIDDMFIQMLVEAKPSQKSLNALGKLLIQKTTKENFDKIAGEAWERVIAKKSESKFSKLFKINKSRSDKANKKKSKKDKGNI